MGRGEEGKKILVHMGMLPWKAMQLMMLERIPLMPLLLIFPECLEKTILFMPRFLKLDLSVMVKLMEVTMLILRLNAKHFIFAQLMELEVWPSTASSVLMVHSSTRTISYVTGGSILTAPLLRISTLLMMKLLLNVKLLLLMLSVVMELLQIMQQLLLLLGITQLGMMLVLVPIQRKAEGAGGWEVGEITEGEEEEVSEDKSRKIK